MSRGYILVEVLIAMFIFAFAVIGLSLSLQRIIEAEHISRRLIRVQMELESRIAEAREEILTTGEENLGEDDLGVRYEREVELLELETDEGQPITGLLQLTIRAFEQRPDGSEDLIEFARVYVYQPQ